MKIPYRYQNAKIEQVPASIREKFEAMKTTRKGIYLHGDVGTGKTHLAYALCSATRATLGVEPDMWNVSELLREIRADFDRKEKRHIEEELMRFGGLLFLDDLGAEKTTEWVGETLYIIINQRYNRVLPTIITSNLPLAALADRVGDRTVSRIAEMCDVVELVGEDRRITNQGKTQIKI